MWEKVKDFFKKPIVIIAEGAIIAIGAIGLFVGGITATEIVPKIVTIGVSLLVAVEAGVTITQGISKLKK